MLQAKAFTSPAERFILPTLLLLFLSVNLLTLTRYPVAWMDEVMFVDPGITLATTGHFRSGVWHWQPADRFFTAYQPLYPLLIGGWVEVWGVGIWQVRTLNLLIVLLCIGLLYRTTGRLGWIGHLAPRIALLLMLATAMGMAFSYRGARIDWWMALLCTSIGAALVLPRPRLRLGVLALLGLLLPWTGMQVLVYAGLVGLLSIPFLQRAGLRWLPGYLALALGGAVGTGALLLLYDHMGTLEVMLDIYGWVSGRGALAGGGFDHRNHLPKDPALLILTALALYLRLSRLRAAVSPVLNWSLVCLLAVPPVMLLLGKFPTYYVWMVDIPLMLGVCAEWSRRLDAGDAPRRTLWGGTGLVVATGLPLLLLLSTLDWRDRDPRAFAAYVQVAVPTDAVVMADYHAYYALKQHVTQYYAWRHLEMMDTAQKATVTHLVVAPEQIDYVVEALGGTWEQQSSYTPSQPSAMWQLTGRDIDLAVVGQQYEIVVLARKTQP
ncbi:MAG: hypothetical protein OHK0039_38850 [Bacteroidia bacterium]